jgi:hypothetical protein
VSLKDNTAGMGMACLAVVGAGVSKNVEREKETLRMSMVN